MHVMLVLSVSVSTIIIIPMLVADINYRYYTNLDNVCIILFQLFAKVVPFVFQAQEEISTQHLVV